jgi:PKD domain-containing protein/concanavalin A-like lectin/glucanase superfamily protein
MMSGGLLYDPFDLVASYGVGHILSQSEVRVKAVQPRRFFRRVRGAVLAVTVLAAYGISGGVGAGQVQADTDPPAGTPATVSSDALPTWQVNGVVWSMVTVGTTVYAVGNFTKARPPGVAEGGAGEATRNNILAFNITTGNLITSFDHSLNGQAFEVVAAPDGSRIYVGGEFTSVDGQVRNRLAAFNTATGALDAGFNPSISGPVRGIAPTATTVYFGGNFFGVNGSPRTRLAAVHASNGDNISTWVPTADDDEVMTMAMAPSGTRVIVGGRFQTLNGTPRRGVGALDATTGALATWNSNPTPVRTETNWSYPTDFHVAGGVLYSADEGQGWHWFDGRWAANPENGDLIWLNNCYGASYGVFATGQVLYSVSHAHDCTSIGTFPERTPQWFARAMGETIYPVNTDFGGPSNNSEYTRQPVPGPLHWYPNVALGEFTGQFQGAWAVTGNSEYVALGGEFPRVNGVAQQGLTRFAVKSIATNKSGPIADELGTPAATALPTGYLRVAWKSTWDRDNETLTYEVLRDGGTTPVGTVRAPSYFWDMPNLGFVDKTATPGVPHTYRIRAKDPAGNTVTSAPSAEATGTAGTPSYYADEVARDGAENHWRLGEPSGTTGYDQGGNDLTFGTGVTPDQPGVLSGDTDTAASFNGTTAGSSGTAQRRLVARNFTIEAWFRTGSTQGGKIVGFGNAQSGNSTAYDRHLYLTNDGRVIFGLYPGQIKTLTSAAGLNDDQWHHVVGTLSEADGMTLFVDGVQIGADATVKRGEYYPGYWRVGGDQHNGWPSRPTSNYLNGTIDEVAYYAKTLSAARIAEHHGIGRGTILPNQAPTAAFTETCQNLVCEFSAANSSDPDGTIESYEWDFGDGTTGSGQTVSHTYGQGGDYPVTLKVTDNRGGTDEETKQLTVTSPTLASDTFTRTVTGGWGTAPVGGAWSAIGSAADLSVNGSTGQITLPAVSVGRGASLAGVSATGTDTTVKLSSNKVVNGNGAYVWITGRRITGAGEYRARVRLMPDGRVALMLLRLNADGTDTTLVAEQVITGLSYAPGTALSVRVQVTGTAPTTVRAKVWAAGTTEPAAWQQSVTDDGAGLQAAGSVRLNTFLSGSSTSAPVVISVDDYRVMRTD